MEINPVTIESLAVTVQALQAKLAEANQKIETHQSELSVAAQRVQTVERELAHASLSDRTDGLKPRINRPCSFNGKGSFKSWTLKMDNYDRDIDPSTAFNIAINYLSGNSNEWWIVYKNSEEGKVIDGWPSLREALTRRLDTLNREKTSRDKLAKWKQVKDVATFNEDFLRIILDIPNINVEEEIDRFTRGLKPYIWREMCTKNILFSLMR